MTSHRNIPTFLPQWQYCRNNEAIRVNTWFSSQPSSEQATIDFKNLFIFNQKEILQTMFQNKQKCSLLFSLALFQLRKQHWLTLRLKQKRYAYYLRKKRLKKKLLQIEHLNLIEDTQDKRSVEIKHNHKSSGILWQAQLQLEHLSSLQLRLSKARLR